MRGGRIPKPLAQELARRITIAHTTRRDRPLQRPVIVLAETPGDAVSLRAAALAFERPYFV